MIEEAQDQALPSVGNLWAVFRRRRWWILLPIFLCWALVWSGS